MKLLIVAPAWVGDMVMAHTLVTVLQSRGSDTEPAGDGYRHRIHLLAPPATLPLAERMPGVDQGIPFDVKHGELGLGRRWREGRRLAAEGYDQALVLPNSFKSALVPWAAGIARRTGWHGEARFGVLNDRRRLDKEAYPLMIERFMALALPPGAALPEPYPRPRLATDPDNLARIEREFDLDASGRVLALCPGAEFGPAKQWPAGHYAAVARAALDDGQDVWLLGGPGDVAVCGAIETQAGAAGSAGLHNLAGRTRLVDAVDLLGAAQSVVCNDSGLMHVACAVDVPVVAVYGSTSPGFTPPLGDAARVVSLGLECSPCFQRTCPLGHTNCLNDLGPERVLDALRQGGRD